MRDSGLIRQSPTDFCGPLSIVVEWARRKPQNYVHCVRTLLEDGKITTGSGRVIEADAELRDLPIPDDPIGHADWMLAATMREDRNINLDIEDGEGWEADPLDHAAGGLQIGRVDASMVSLLASGGDGDHCGLQRRPSTTAASVSSSSTATCSRTGRTTARR